MYFTVAKWGDESKTWVVRIHPYCQTCQRLIQRQRKNHKPRVASKTGYAGRTEEEKAVYREYQRKRYEGLSEEQRERRRKKNTENARKRRQREFRRELDKLTLGYWKDTDRLLEAAPLAEFVEEMIHRHGISAVATATATGTESLQDLVAGRYTRVTIDVADRILVGLNYPEQLVILYPHA